LDAKIYEKLLNEKLLGYENGTKFNPFWEVEITRTLPGLGVI
jgi:hypothetical protein